MPRSHRCVFYFCCANIILQLSFSPTKGLVSFPLGIPPQDLRSKNQRSEVSIGRDVFCLGKLNVYMCKQDRSFRRSPQRTTNQSISAVPKTWNGLFSYYQNIQKERNPSPTFKLNPPCCCFSIRLLRYNKVCS